VTKPGHRVRLLAHLEEASVGKLTTRRKEKQNKLEGRLIPAPEPNTVARDQLQDWLTGMNVGDLFPLFLDSGYDDLDEIYYLMTTNYALTDKVLEDIGVTKPGFRTRILINLQNYLTSLEG
jgi:hypothetical protein